MLLLTHLCSSSEEDVVLGVILVGFARHLRIVIAVIAVTFLGKEHSACVLRELEQGCEMLKELIVMDVSEMRILGLRSLAHLFWLYMWCHLLYFAVF